MFNSTGELIFDDPEFFNTYAEKFSIAIKTKFVFYELPYLEHLKIAHLLDHMHIFKKQYSYLWMYISSK